MHSSEGLNIIEILNEIKETDYNPEEYSDIFLFFDYDGHDDKASDEKIIEMLKYFNNSTINGKLYINYPMVESIKMISLDNEKLFFEIDKGSTFKNFVDGESENRLNDIVNYTFSIWQEIITKNLQKVNYLLKKEKDISDYSELRIEIKDGLEIFSKQKEKYIDTNNKVMILNSFPIFICNYVREPYYKKLIR